MSIDEAIARAREVAEKQRKDNNNCKYKKQYGCKGCAEYYSKPCIECAREHEQLAEWLEELKELRERNFDYAQLIDTRYKDGYKKAIDDFVEALKQEILCEIFNVSESQKIYEVGSHESEVRSHIMGTLRDVNNRIVDKIAEQLKEKIE